MIALYAGPLADQLKIRFLLLLDMAMKLGSAQWGVNRNDPLASTLNKKGAVPLPGLPRWLSGWESTTQCRKHRFNPQVGKTPWRRKWQAAPVFLPGESHWQKNLMGSVHRIAKSWTQMSMHACTHSFFHSHSPYSLECGREKPLILWTNLATAKQRDGRNLSSQYHYSTLLSQLELHDCQLREKLSS